MSILQDSWSSFSNEIADRYLREFGSPSVESKVLLADVLKEMGKGRTLDLIELGCGNGQLAEFFQECNLDFTYTGVDFSTSLLAAADRRFQGTSHIRFVNDDVEQLTTITRRFDVAIYSHVIEMLSSPEASLKAARRIANVIAIRFFEPPDHNMTRVELCRLDNGSSNEQGPPYLRWSMGRDFYRLLLSRLGVSRVDLYRTKNKDQVHVLHFDRG